jgi:hypothetical protein
MEIKSIKIFLQKDEVVILLFQSYNFISIFILFLCPKPKVLALNFDFINACFFNKFWH